MWVARIHEYAVYSRKFRWLLILGVGVAALMLGYFFRLQEVRGVYLEGKAHAHALEEARHAKALEVAGREQLNDLLAVARARLQDARWRLSAGADAQDLLEHLGTAGRTYGLTFERIEFEAPVKEDDHIRLPLHLSVSGRYPALRLWLEQWGAQLRALQVSSLVMSEVEGQDGVLQLQLVGQAFHAGEALPMPASLADEPARHVLPAPRADPFAPWSSRQALGGLAGVPLEQLQMVGSLSRGGRTHALLAYVGRLYRIAEGERLGREEGVVTQVDERQLEIQERLFVAGHWQVRSRYLVMHRDMDQEVMDERKAAVGVGDDPGPVDGRVGEGL